MISQQLLHPLRRSFPNDWIFRNISVEILHRSHKFWKVLPKYSPSWLLRIISSSTMLQQPNEHQSCPLLPSHLYFPFFKFLIVWPFDLLLREWNTSCGAVFDCEIIKHYQSLDVHVEEMGLTKLRSLHPWFGVVEIPVRIVQVRVLVASSSLQMVGSVWA